MSTEQILLPLRTRALRAITAFLWMNVAAILPVGFALNSSATVPVFLLGLAVTLLPTTCCLKGRIDPAGRIVLGLALAVYPMLFVALFKGDPWQMDAHMYFFVCFSVMILLCDPRPVLAATALTLAHHLILYVLLPHWIFPGSGSLPRVLFHGALVGCEAAIVMVAIRIITRLTVAANTQRIAADDARARAEQALAQAESEREGAQRALERSIAAEARAEAAQRERLLAEAQLAEARQTRRLATAGQIDDSVAAVIEDLLSVAKALAQQAGEISSVSARLEREAVALNSASDSAVSSIESMARNSEELSNSIRSVGENAGQAQGVALATANSVASLGPGIDTLSRELDAARDILRLVSEIASQSNLLALNATIEAARSGEAGRGFAIVAAEMKQMATATSRAAAEIGAKLGAIIDAAAVFQAMIGKTTTHVEQIRASSDAISQSVKAQALATDAIARETESVRARVGETDQRSRAITLVATDNSGIALRSSVLAQQLGGRAEELRTRIEGLMRELRAA